MLVESNNFFIALTDHENSYLAIIPSWEKQRFYVYKVLSHLLQYIKLKRYQISKKSNFI